MATWTAATVGAVTTYTVTDTLGQAGTLAVTTNATTGFTTALTGSALHNDGLQTMITLMNLIATNKLPTPAPNAASFT